MSRIKLPCAVVLALAPAFAGAAEVGKIAINQQAMVAVSGPKPLARHFVGALGGYSTGATTRIVVGVTASSPVKPADMRVVLRNLATGAVKIPSLADAPGGKAFNLDGYGPCPAGTNQGISDAQSKLATEYLWEVDVYGPAEMPNAQTAPKAYTTNLAVFRGTGMSFSRAAGLRWFNPATLPDGGANWNPGAHKGVDFGCHDPAKRPGPEPWPEPEPSSTNVGP